MKKRLISLDKALFLDKEIIAQLNEQQLSTLEGGVSETATCHTKVADDGDAGFPPMGSCNACSCNG